VAAACGGGGLEAVERGDTGRLVGSVGSPSCRTRTRGGCDALGRNERTRCEASRDRISAMTRSLGRPCGISQWKAGAWLFQW
jgi:hypothetical protein